MLSCRSIMKVWIICLSALNQNKSHTHHHDDCKENVSAVLSLIPIQSLGMRLGLKAHLCDPHTHHPAILFSCMLVQQTSAHRLLHHYISQQLCNTTKDSKNVSDPTPATLFSFLAIRILLQVKRLPLRNTQEEITKKNSDSKLPWGPAVKFYVFSQFVQFVT